MCLGRVQHSATRVALTAWLMEGSLPGPSGFHGVLGMQLRCMRGLQLNDRRKISRAVPGIARSCHGEISEDMPSFLVYSPAQ